MGNKYKNKKLPGAPYDDQEEDSVKPDYPWLSGEATINGGHRYRYENPDDFEGSFTEEFRPDTGFNITKNSTDENGGVNYSLNHHVRNYASRGVSNHGDGHNDFATEASNRSNVRQDSGVSTAGDNFNGVGGLIIEAANKGIVRDAPKGPQVMMTDGDQINEYIGDINSNFEGDLTRTISGNEHTIISSSKNGKGVGEWGLHLQDGNGDIQADKGKFRIKTVGDNLILDSTVKIIIQVGSSSITLEPGQITVKAAAVKFEKA
jgi:hypothetical protein